MRHLGLWKTRRCRSATGCRRSSPRTSAVRSAWPRRRIHRAPSRLMLPHSMSAPSTWRRLQPRISCHRMASRQGLGSMLMASSASSRSLRPSTSSEPSAPPWARTASSGERDVLRGPTINGPFSSTQAPIHPQEVDPDRPAEASEQGALVPDGSSPADQFPEPKRDLGGDPIGGLRVHAAPDDGIAQRRKPGPEPRIERMGISALLCLQCRNEARCARRDSRCPSSSAHDGGSFLRGRSSFGSRGRIAEYISERVRGVEPRLREKGEK